MADTPKKRRGRPLKTTADDDSALGQRRARVRQAQRSFRRRKEDTLGAQAKKILLLETALENMSNTFLQLSDTMLRAGEVQMSGRLVGEIRDATRRVLESVQEVGEEREEGDGRDVDEVWTKEGEDCVLTSADRYHSMDSFPIGSPSPPLPHHSHDALLDWPQQQSPPSDLYSSQITTEPIPTLPFSNPFLSSEFWTGDYTNYTQFPTFDLPPQLPFPLRLLHNSIATSYHALRGDPAYSSYHLTTRSQFRFSTPVRPIGYILASARRVLLQSALWNQNHEEDTPIIERFFEDQPARLFGRDAKAEMARRGEREVDFLDAEGVSEYLNEKGRVREEDAGEGRLMVLRIKVPQRKRKVVVRVDVDTLIERLTKVAVCMGDMVGYPVHEINRAVVRSAKGGWEG